MKRILSLIGALCFSAGISMAAPLWLRYPKISPSGETIAFNYKGDIYTVPTTGGEAKQLTTTPSYDYNPIWRPDGKQIAFASDRDGNMNIYVMDANGSNVRQLTHTSLREIPDSYSPDGKYIYFSALIQDPASSALYPHGSMTELYKVNTDNGAIEQVLATPADALSFSKDGKRFLYQDRKGGENNWRKHHTSSITRDIYLYDLNNSTHTPIYTNPGEDLNPVFGTNDKDVYFLSEQGQSMNVYQMDITSPNNLTKITNFKKHPVRFLSIANNGTLCMNYDGEIYTKTNSSSPKKVDVIIPGDNILANKERVSLSSGASWSTVSPDGKQIAFIVRGNIFVTHVDFNTTKQITDTPEAEECPSFSADGRTLIYSSERNNKRDIYQATIVRPEEKYFSHATLIDEKPLMAARNSERTLPQFSPDGKEVAFIENRNNLMVYNLKSKKTRQITDISVNPSSDGYINYEWSPNSEWFVMSVNDNKHEPYADVAIISADGQQYKNITQSGYMDLSPRWAMNGNAILYITERFGMRNHASWGSQYDAMIAFVNQDAYDKFTMSDENYKLYKEADTTKKKNNLIPVELEDIEKRIVRLTPNSSAMGGANITPDGETLYYLTRFEGGQDLWKSSTRKGEYKLVSKGVGSASLLMDSKGKEMYLLGGTLKKMNIASGAITPIAFNASFILDKTAEREYMFNRVIRQERERFYRTDMHGVDWNSYGVSYARHLPYINNNYDFAEMLSELLGELNVSHTGSGYRAPRNGNTTASLGLIYDLSYSKDGLKIDEVLVGGPLATPRSKVASGDIIEKINGETISTNRNFLDYFSDIAGKNTLISVYRPSTKERWEETVIPISKGSESGLLYSRWVEGRAKAVEELSGGRLGYVHIQGMDDANFRRIYSDILGKYNTTEGIVIDTRFNGGGRMHEDIEILFSGEKYFTQVIRGTESCDMPSRRWNKPSIMLTCEANYSNAHGTPWVYRNRGIGKLVGMPVPGTMTSVSWETLQDPSLYFGIPIVGYRLPDGSYLENQQLEPDFKVANPPTSVVKGEDLQLETAVRELLKEIDARKK
ncbi:MAG: S41 family peptidase [Marinifilaceae bacterium]